MFIAQLNDYMSSISDKNIDNDNMGDPLQQQTFHNVYKFITNISNVKHNQNITNQDFFPNTGIGGDQLTIILNGETILPRPTLSFSTTSGNMTANGTTIGDGVVKTVPNDSPPPR